MSFFNTLFRKGQASKSVVCIDIGAEGIAGAYVTHQKGAQPTLLYTRRLPIEIQKDEPHERAMIRALATLGKDLVRDGTQALVRATTSEKVDLILVSVDAPWQETSVRAEIFEQEEPFLFTKNLVAKRLEEKSSVPSPKMLADESIIGITLNGYESHNPYGNKVRRASVSVLTSLIERDVADKIISTLQKLYRTKNILPISGNSLRFQAMRSIFPQENDAIILDVTAKSLISLSLVQRGTLVTTSQTPTSPDDDVWVSTVTTALAEMAKSYPLPRTIFLLAREPEIDTMRQKLDATKFASIWLSDNPPKIVPILKSHIIALIRQISEASPDIMLLLMIQYYQHQYLQENDEIA